MKSRNFVRILITSLVIVVLIAVGSIIYLYKGISAGVSVKGELLKGMTTEERLEDFDYMYSILKENFPYFEVEKRKTGFDWLAGREDFRNRIKEVKNDSDFYEEIASILRLVQSGHTNLLGPEVYEDYRRLYKGIFNKPWSDVLNNEGSVQKYSFWKGKINESAAILPINFVYVEGKYIVVDGGVSESEKYDIPQFSILKKIGKQTVDEYIKTGLDKRLVVYDSMRNKLKVNRLNIYCNEGESIQMTFETPIGKTIVKNISAEIYQVTGGSNKEEEKVYSTWILRDKKIAYLKVKSFSAFYTERDREGIHEFLSDVKNYPYLIIDIRGNGGGDTDYWRKNIVGPLIEEELTAEFYYAFREGDYIKPFILARGMTPKQIDKIPEGKNYPNELKREFKTFYLSRNKIAPSNSVGFKGKIYLLVDDYVYSSAEALAAFAKATKWATIVGTETGGDGIGIDPAIAALPNSGLIFRFPLEMGLNPDGSSNEESHTLPDIYVEPSYEDFVNYMNFMGNNDGELINPYDTVLNKVLSMIQK